MNKQEPVINTTRRNQRNSISSRPTRYEARRFQRYRIKRRVLLKNTESRVLSGHAHDISRLGMQLRCSSQIAFELLYNNKESDQPDSSGIYEIKISLPYMNTLTECGIHCRIYYHKRLNEKEVRLGIGFQSMNEDSQTRLNHFLNNLSR